MRGSVLPCHNCTQHSCCGFITCCVAKFECPLASCICHIVNIEVKYIVQVVHVAKRTQSTNVTIASIVINVTMKPL